MFLAVFMTISKKIIIISMSDLSSCTSSINVFLYYMSLNLEHKVPLVHLDLEEFDQGG